MNQKKTSQPPIIPLKLCTSNRKLLPIIKKNLREKVPLLTRNELRRLRLNFHEALLLELKESREIDVYNFFNEIIQKDLDESMDLVNNKELIEMIFNELMKTDCSKEEEIKIILNLGKKIEDLEIPIKIWLVDKIYSRALEIIEKFSLKETKIEAFAKFVYGKFLKYEGNFEKAVDILGEALKICEFEEDWLYWTTTSGDWIEENSKKTESLKKFENLDELLSEKAEKLSNLVADELYQSLIELSKKLIKENPENSLKLATKAKLILKFHKIKDKVKKEVDCEIELGNCYETLKDFDKARRHFEHAFEFSGICDLHQVGLEALFKMADCYKKLENFEKCADIFNRALIHAKSNTSTATTEGDILVMLGKFWVERNEKTKALEYFTKATRIFEKTQESKKLRELRIIMAFPMAENSFNNLVEAILRSDKEICGKKPYTSMLQKWQVTQREIQIFEEDLVDSETFIKRFVDPDEITKITDPEKA